MKDATEAMESVYCRSGNKMITTSGGGALVCKTEEDRKTTMFYATQARENFPYYQHEKFGYNYRMSNICAGIGRGQMTILEEHVAHHRHVNALYQAAFAGVDGITVQTAPSADFDSNFWLSTILIDKVKTGVDYNDIMAALAKVNVETIPLWKPLHLQPVFAECPSYVNGVSERLFEQGLCLPSGPCVTDEDVAFIVEEVLRVIGIQIERIERKRGGE